MPNVRDFEKRLQRHDRFLAVENLGDHYTIVDKSKPISYRTINLGGAVRYEPTYQRVLHLAPHQQLDGAVINEIKRRDMRRWERGADWKHHVQKQVEAAEAVPEKARAEAVKTLAKESFSHIRGNPVVTVSGNKDGKLYDASGKAI